MSIVKVQPLRKWAGEDLHSQELSSHVIITDTICGQLESTKDERRPKDDECKYVISLYNVRPWFTRADVATKCLDIVSTYDLVLPSSF